MISQDLLWKMILRVLALEAVHFFFPLAKDELDEEEPLEFLDKELQRIFPKSMSKNRVADMLLKAKMKNGEEKIVYFHFEVQGYGDMSLHKRMMQMRNRIYERYGSEPIALVIYTGEPNQKQPTRYFHERWGVMICYEWRTFNVWEHPPESISQKDNIFSIPIELAYRRLRQGKLNDLQLIQLKTALIRRLLEKNYDREIIHSLILFIDSCVSFEQENSQATFENKISEIFQTNNKMDVIEAVIREIKKDVRRRARIEGRAEGRAEGISEGIEKGIEKGIQKGRIELLTVTIPLLLKTGFTPEQIATELKIELELVHELMSKIPSDN